MAGYPQTVAARNAVALSVSRPVVPSLGTLVKPDRIPQDQWEILCDACFLTQTEIARDRGVTQPSISATLSRYAEEYGLLQTARDAILRSLAADVLYGTLAAMRQGQGKGKTKVESVRDQSFAANVIRQLSTVAFADQADQQRGQADAYTPPKAAAPPVLDLPDTTDRAP